MTMKEMQVAVGRLTKGIALIAEKLGLLMAAIGSKQGPAHPPATPTRTYENPTPPGVAEVPSDSDAQRQIAHARRLAKCKSALEWHGSSSVTVPSRSRETQDALDAVVEHYHKSPFKLDPKGLVLANELNSRLLPPPSVVVDGVPARPKAPHGQELAAVSDSAGELTPVVGPHDASGFPAPVNSSDSRCMLSAMRAAAAAGGGGFVSPTPPKSSLCPAEPRFTRGPTALPRFPPSSWGNCGGGGRRRSKFH